VRVWEALSDESVLYSHGRFPGLFSCGAWRWSREDVGVFPGGAVMLGACALCLWWVLVVVVGGAGVLVERSVCLGGGVLWCFFPICVLGGGVEAGVCTIWCWVIFLFFVVLVVVGVGVIQKKCGCTLCESLG
jgi:hypothetical protein